LPPITFSIDELIPASPTDIANQLLDPARWQAFQGVGSIPGIAKAEFETMTKSLVGTKIRITNADGSTCLATITEWRPNTRHTVKMADFTGSLSGLVASIEQILEFEPDSEGLTKVTQYVHISPTSESAIPALHDIALDLKMAMLLNSHSVECKSLQAT